MSKNIIREKSFAFALDIIKLYKKLRNCREYIISSQLLRSGTSIGANVEEGVSTQSDKDFVSKMAIATKEACETRYWLLLLRESELTDINVIRELEGADELLRILVSIVKTSQEKTKKASCVKPIHNS